MVLVITFRIFSIIITGSDEMYVNIAKLQNINTMVYEIIKTNIIKQQYMSTLLFISTQHYCDLTGLNI